MNYQDPFWDIKKKTFFNYAFSKEITKPISWTEKKTIKALISYFNGVSLMEYNLSILSNTRSLALC